MHVSHVIVTLTYSRHHDNCTDPNSGEMLERATETNYGSFFFYVLGTYQKNPEIFTLPPFVLQLLFLSLRNSNPNSMKDVCRFNSLRSGPTRPLLLMISGRASELSTRRSYHGSHPCRETSFFFPSCCLTIYKTFFSETFIFQEIIHLGKESKN